MQLKYALSLHHALQSTVESGDLVYLAFLYFRTCLHSFAQNWLVKVLPFIHKKCRIISRERLRHKNLPVNPSCRHTMSH